MEEMEESMDEHMDVTMSLSDIISDMNSSDYILNERATKCLSEMLSKDKEPPIDEIIEAGLVKVLVKFLGYDGCIIQHEAARALMSIGSGTSERTKKIVDAGARSEFIRLLMVDSQDDFIVERCVWGLGRIAGEGYGKNLTDIISSGIIEALLHVLDIYCQPGVLHAVAWTLSNLFCCKSTPLPMETFKLFLPSLMSMMEYTEHGIILNTCWALSYAIDRNFDNIQLVVEFPGMLAKLVELLHSPNPSIVAGALQTLCNISAGDDSQTQAVIECNLLNMMPALLRHPEANIIGVACRILSNITAGSTEQIQAVIDSNLLIFLMAVLIAGKSNNKKEACRAFTYLAIRGTPEQVVRIFEAHAIEPLCDLLTTNDTRLLFLILLGICCVLTAAKKVGKLVPVSLLLEEIGGCSKIEDLQDHENSYVSKKAQEITLKFFTIERVDKVPAAASTKGNKYQFRGGGFDARFQF